MRPNTEQNGKGKAPARRPAAPKRPAPAPLVDSDDDWEEDQPVVDPQPGRHREVAFRHQINPDNPNQLPLELLPRRPQHFDLSDDEGEDHTGVWQDGDLEALVLGLNHYRSMLKGKFSGTASGKERKKRGWEQVAAYVNMRCATLWTSAQCKGKGRRFCLEVKNKYNVLRRELAKTGNREIPEHMYLNKVEEMVLDYIGVEGVIGIPGIHAVPLRPDMGRDYLKMRTQTAARAWNPEREAKPNYRDQLPMARIRLERRRRQNNE